MALFVIGWHELGEPLFPECWTEDEMDCMTEVSTEAYVDGSSGDAEALLSRT